MGDLIVKDDEHQTLADKLSEAGTVAEEQLDKFLSVMQAICDNGVSEGDTHANIVSFTTEVKKMKGLIKDITKPASDDVKTFVRQIDIADEYLYN